MNLEQKPEKASADAGYFSEANVTDAAVTGSTYTSRRAAINMATKRPAAMRLWVRLRARMRHKLRTEAGRAVYTMRKAIVEPVFGQIKERRGFRRFSLRGKQNVGNEWRLVCAVSNLLKLFRSKWTLETA